MVERTPDFFLRYCKNFRYIVAYKEPVVGQYFISTVNYAFGIHSTEHNLYCEISLPHYHLLLETRCGNQSNKHENKVRCLYSTYFFHLHQCKEMKHNGEIVMKLREAVDYNDKMGRTVFSDVRKELKRKSRF